MTDEKQKDEKPKKETEKHPKNQDKINQMSVDDALIISLRIPNRVFQKMRQENAIEALKEQLAPEATVIRGGEKNTIDAEDLVPGDIIQARMVQGVPADAKLLHGDHLNVDESGLTGESLPVDKQEGDLIFSGTSVKRGKAKALASATGNGSKFARTVDLVDSAENSTHFQKALMRIGYFYVVFITYKWNLKKRN